MGFVDIFMKQNLRLPGRYPFEIVIDLPVFLIADGISPIGRNAQKTIPAEQPKPRLDGGNGKACSMPLRSLPAAARLNKMASTGSRTYSPMRAWES